MLHILLLILKIIGIALLVILGLIVLILLVILFVPVRYQLKAETNDGIKQLNINGRASWLLHLMSAKFAYNNGFEWEARLGWKMYPKKTKQESQSMETVTKESSTREAGSTESPEKESVKTESVETESVAKESPEKESKTKKTAKSLLNKLKCTITNIYDKIKRVWDLKEQIIHFLTDESHISAFQSVKREIVILARRARPRKIKGFVRFGLEDPYTTGQVLAGLSVLYPFYGENIQIFPEFEHSILEGDLYIKGYIRLIHILIPACKLYFDNDVRKTYYDYKRRK